MADGFDLDDLKRAFDAVTPGPDPARKRENIARAEGIVENISARAQGSREAARHIGRKSRMSRLVDRVKIMNSVWTYGAGFGIFMVLVTGSVVWILSGPRLLEPAVEVASISSRPESGSRPIGQRLSRSYPDEPSPESPESLESLDAIGVPASIGPVGISEAPIHFFKYDHEAFASADMVDVTASIEPAWTGSAPIGAMPDTEAFASADANRLKTVTEDPVSTFSVDVDTASYGVVRSSLTAGFLPPKDAVRVEEMVNYFPYAYPAPEGPHPFEPTVSVVPTPWNAGTRLVHIAIQGETPAVEDRPPLNLVFLIDTSGSMGDANRLPLLKRSLQLMLPELRPEDEIAIVTYAGSADQVLEPTRATERAVIMDALDRLESRGSTAGHAGLQQAYRVAEGMADDLEVTRVILATDGDFNVGISDPDELKDFIARKRGRGIYLGVLGFGRGNLDDATMQALAQNGNGQAAYIDTLGEARKTLVDQLTGALFPIADDVKIQVEFNPAAIAEYRLIGYGTRALNREDFGNDRVDAGDIGAGHRVTAIYEVTPVGSDAAMVEPLRYGDGTALAGDPDGYPDEIGFLRLRYKRPGESGSSLIERAIPVGMTGTSGPVSEDVRFSVAMAGFGQLLRGGVHLGGWTWEDAIALAAGARGEDTFGYRAEAVALMRLAQALDR